MDGALVTVLGQQPGKVDLVDGISGALELTTLKVVDMFTHRVLCQVNTLHLQMVVQHMGG
jgi:hypothetical protein